MNRTDEMIKKTANAFIEKIEAFDGEWKKPFFSSDKPAINIVSKKFYRGINLVTLWISQEENNYTSNKWGTFDQWKAKGKSIKKGEKGTLVFFFKPVNYDVEVTNDNGETEVEEHESCLLRYYIVFNECQISEYVPEQTEETPPDIIEETNQFKENFLNKTGIFYEEGKGKACYVPSIDKVYLPNIEQFTDKSAYIPTACHEFIHATGSKNRLNRDFSGKFGDESYAFEELIADIGAGFVASALGKQYIFQNNNIAYLKSWVKVLKDQPKAILKACSHAQKATDFLLKSAEINAITLEELQ